MSQHANVFTGHGHKHCVINMGQGPLLCATSTALIVLVLLQLVSEIQAIDCSDMSLGVENQEIIPNANMNATSYFSSAYYPYYGRLGSTKPWATKGNNDPSDYLEIDLGRLFKICGVKTQGSAYSHSEWVTSYKLQFSSNGLQWKMYREGGKDKVFNGNSDQSTVVANTFSNNPVLARFIRFIPVTYRGHKTMRVAVYGTIQGCNNKTFDDTPKYLPDKSYSSSTIYNCRYSPSTARLFSVMGWAPIKNTDPKDYLQLDFEAPYSICAIGTQGCAQHKEWVTSFMMNISIDGKSWETYQNGIKKYFSGNQDQNTLLVQYINTTTVTSVRFIPITFKGHKTMRVGVFGFEKPVHIKIAKEKMTPLIKACAGDKVTISCYATGPQPIKYSWSLNGSVIDTAVVHQVDNVLIVTPKSAKHFGTYICRASRGSPWDSYGVKVQKINCPTQPTGKLRIEEAKMTSIVKAEIGDKVVLVCFATSPSRPIKYKWTKDGKLISNAASINISDNVLVVKPETEKDFGTFVCMVDDGKDATSYPITVRGFSIA